MPSRSLIVRSVEPGSTPGGWSVLFEVPANDEWAGRAEVVSLDGTWVVASLQVAPTTADWSWELPRFSASDVPAMGMRTTDVLRKIPLAEVTRAIAGVRWNADMTLVDAFNGPGTSKAMRRRPARRRLTETDYALWAQKYAVLVLESPSPVKDLAAAEGFNYAYVRDIIVKARDIGVLTRPPSQGKPGGELTAKGRALIEAEAAR